MLNEALTLEKTATSALLSLIVPCTGKIIESEKLEYFRIDDQALGMTVLGLLNSIFGFTDGDESYRIFPVFDSNNQITEFRLGIPSG